MLEFLTLVSVVLRVHVEIKFLTKDLISSIVSFVMSSFCLILAELATDFMLRALLKYQRSRHVIVTCSSVTLSHWSDIIAADTKRVPLVDRML